MRRIWIPLLVSLLSISGVAVAADALVVTQQEELDSFVDDITAPKAEARLDGALSYANPSQVPLRLSVDNSALAFGEGQSSELADAVRSALAVFDSDKQTLLQHSVRVDGERATVTARLGDEAYEQTVIYELTRSGERWLLRSIRVL